MTTRKLLALATGAFLIASTGMLAQTKSTTKSATTKTPAPKAAPTKTTNGTITSADAGRLVLSQKKGSKTEEMTFMLSPSTTKKGDLAPGAKATVHYRVESGQNMATSVSATPAKPASTKSTTKTKFR